MPTIAEGLEHWYTALGEPIGHAFRVSGDRALMAKKLYAARAEAKDPDLDQLAMVMSPMEDDVIWILHRKPKADGNTA